VIASFSGTGDPVVSVDAKKKEQPGPYHRDGRRWRPRGNPVRVRDHDFPGEELGKIIPYGIYDVAANRGFVSAGTSCDTAAFAVNALRLWWRREGSLRYPDARRLLVTCDAGGSGSCAGRLWKDQLAVLAGETGLVITVCHFPPGTRTRPSGGTIWTERTASRWTGTWCCDSRPSSSGTAPAMSPPDP
jgi:Rhodopirellula transposase DDE domain